MIQVFDICDQANNQRFVAGEIVYVLKEKKSEQKYWYVLIALRTNIKLIF